MSIRLLALAAAATLVPSLALAQQLATRAPRQPSAAAVQRALATITEADYGAELGALAHDSTRGRETPSPELAKATDWVATRFRAAGLRPAGDEGGYLQRFQLRHSRFDSLSEVTIAGGGQNTRWMLGRDVIFFNSSASSERANVPVVLMTGVPADTARPFGDVPVRGAAILLVAEAGQLRSAVLDPLANRAVAEGAAAFAVLVALPDDRWAQFARRAYPESWSLTQATGRSSDARLGMYQVRLEASAGLLRAAGEDPATVLAPERRTVRPLPGFTFAVAPHTTVVEEPTVANVVGVLEGSDPTLREEAVVFTAHMDHVGVVGGRCRPARALPADSICNGADDDASGVTGVIELAEAFAALQPRPARTLVFAAVTAEERGLLGAYHYTAHPVIPIERTAANINLDMIAHNPPDTVGLVEKDYTSLGGVVDRALAAHPELRLALKAHPGPYAASDHFPFAQRGVPALFFFSGIHDDLHTASDNVNPAGIEQATRITRLAFLVALDVANAVDRPVWDPQARARIVR